MTKPVDIIYIVKRLGEKCNTEAGYGGSHSRLAIHTKTTYGVVDVFNKVTSFAAPLLVMSQL